MAPRDGGGRTGGSARSSSSRDSGGRSGDRSGDQQRTSGRGGRQEAGSGGREREKRPAPAVGSNEVFLRGAVIAEPSLRDEDNKTPQLYLRVQIEEDIGDEKKKRILGVAIWGDSAYRFSDGKEAVQIDDIVELVGRHGTSVSNDGKKNHRISLDHAEIESGDCSLKVLFDDEANAPDEIEITLEGDVDGKWWQDRYEDSGKRRIRGTLTTAVEAPDREPIQRWHNIILWDEAADVAWDKCGDGARIRFKGGRLLNTSHDNGETFTPVVVFEKASEVEVIEAVKPANESHGGQERGQRGGRNSSQGGRGSASDAGGDRARSGSRSSTRGGSQSSGRGEGRRSRG